MTMHSRTPLRVALCLVRCSYHVRGILIGFSDMVAEMNLLKQVCKMFLNGIPTVNRSCVRYDNSVLCVERGQRGRIVVVPCLVKFLNERVEPLAVLLIWCRFFLFSKDRESKAGCQSCKGNCRSNFYFFLSVFGMICRP